jgi:hypothetical protein
LLRKRQIDFEAVSQRLNQIAEARGERVPDFKSRMEVVNHIRRRWRNTFEDVIETGCLLILNGFSARDFPRRRVTDDQDTKALQLSYHTARRLMLIAQSERINNAVDRHLFPDSWYSLFLISWMPKTMYEKAKAAGVIHRTCSQRDIVSFIRYQKGFAVGEEIVIRLTDRPLGDFGDFQGRQDRFEALRDGLMSFLDKHRDEAWGEIITSITIKTGWLPKID